MPGSPQSLALKEFNDWELLHIVSDMSDPDNDEWANAELIADRIGITHPNPIRCVVGRMRWMGTYGAVEQHPDEPYMYRLTDIGEAVIGKRGSLTATQRKALDAIREEQLLPLMTEVARAFTRNYGGTPAILMRRHWQHSWDNRPR